ncbi:MAG: peptidoglycan-binding protein, partial [Proteobacteria bacterium]|nr:peptidoglycan-binding protein [Pseudomonadota bacterium]
MAFRRRMPKFGPGPDGGADRQGRRRCSGAAGCRARATGADWHGPEPGLQAGGYDRPHGDLTRGERDTMRATIGYGYSNARDDVRAAQGAINALGFGPIDTDGAFGPATRAAVVRLQRARSLDADGIVGPATWAALTATTATTMPTRASLIAAGGSGIGLEVALLALADVGAAEDPPRSNQGPEIAHLVDGYRAYWAIGGMTEPPWCAIAVSSWIRLALGLPMWTLDGRARPLAGHPFERWLGAVSQLQDWGRTRGLLLPSDAMVRPGMLALRERAGSGSD